MDFRCKRRSLSQNSTRRTLDNKMANEDVYAISSDACADKMPMCYPYDLFACVKNGIKKVSFFQNLLFMPHCTEWALYTFPAKMTPAHACKLLLRNLVLIVILVLESKALFFHFRRATFDRNLIHSVDAFYIVMACAGFSYQKSLAQHTGSENKS